jgi:hypothetical protein
MYSLYPLAFLAGYLIWATINYLDKDSEPKKVEFDKRP